MYDLLDLLAKELFGSLLHLGKDHSGDLLGSELAAAALVVNRNGGFTALVENVDGPVLHVALHFRFIHFTANETLCVKDPRKKTSVSYTKGKKNIRVVWVHGDLIFGGITDETLGVREGDVGRGCPITLIVGDDLNAVILPDTNATG